jgi:hypothetical protein
LLGKQTKLLGNKLNDKYSQPAENRYLPEGKQEKRTKGGSWTICIIRAWFHLALSGKHLSQPSYIIEEEKRENKGETPNE